MGCFFCDSEDIYVVQHRINRFEKKPIYRCRICKRRFTKGLINFRYKKEIIDYALSLLFQKYTLSEVCSCLSTSFNVSVSRKTILDWQKKFK